MLVGESMADGSHGEEAAMYSLLYVYHANVVNHNYNHFGM